MKACTNSVILCILVTVISFSFVNAYDYCTVLHKSLLFYEAQRSGRLPASNRIPWRGNSALNDATSPSASRDENGDGNLAGGYYDAGDNVKFAFPLAFTTTTLAWGLIEFGDAVYSCGELTSYLNAIKWSTDWMLKAHTGPYEFYGQVGNATADHAFWVPPERTAAPRPSYKIDANRPGTDLAMEVAAALAAASIVFQSRDAVYATTLLSHARQMYSFGDKYRGFYHDSITDAANFYRSYGYFDEIAWASAWLYRATGENVYLTRAIREYNDQRLSSTTLGQSFDWDQKGPGVLLLMANITADPRYLVDAQRWLASWQPGGMVTYTPGGLAWLREWGPLRYTAGSAFLAILVPTTAGNDWAKGQINYMLGSNPLSRSFVCGFGLNPPVNPRHRAAHGSTTNNINVPTNNLHVLDGALVGGPGIEDDYVDLRTDSNKNEVALDFNAAFTVAVAGLAKLTGIYPAPPNGPTSYPTAPPPPPTTAPTPTPRPTSTPSPTPTPTSTPTPTLPPAGSTLQLQTHQACSAWWFAISIVGDLPVYSISIKGANQNTYSALTVTDWGYWIYTPPGYALSTPVTLRFEISGEFVLFSLGAIVPGIIVDTGIPLS